MADVNKKINIDVNSNVELIQKSFKSLQDAINKVTDALKKLNKEELQATNTSKNEYAKVLQTKLAGHNMTVKLLREELKLQKESITASRDEYNKNLQKNKVKAEFSRSLVGTNIFGGIKSNLFVSDPGEDIAKLLSIPSALLEKVPEKVSKTTGGISSKGEAIISDKTKELSAVQAQLDVLSSKKKLTPKQQQYKSELESQKSNLVKDISRTKIITNLTNSTIKSFAGALKLTLQPFDALTKAVKGTVQEMLNFNTGIATINTTTSLISNRAAREVQMQYGLSASQYYGISTAANLLNIRSEEDFMYMNVAQREKFNKYIEQYSNWYTKMENSGVLENIQSMQLEFKEFKQEIAMDFLDWVSKNKEPILTTIKAIMHTTMTISSAIMSIVSMLNFGHSISASENMNVSPARIANISINMDTTINNDSNNNSTSFVDSLKDEVKSAVSSVF